MRSSFSVAQRCREWLRDLSNFVVPRDPVMRWVFQRADKLLVTRDTLPLVPPRWRHKCQAQLAIGLTSEYLNHVDVADTHPAVTLIAFSMSVDCWSGKASTSRSTRSVDFKQSQPERSLHHRWRWSSEETIAQLGGRTWDSPRSWNGSPGSLTTEWQNYYSHRDVFLFPSLRIPAVWRSWKPWRTGCRWYAPTSAGPGVIVNEGCGRVVSAASKQQEQIVSGLVEALREIATTPTLRDSLAAGAARPSAPIQIRKSRRFPPSTGSYHRASSPPHEHTAAVSRPHIARHRILSIDRLLSTHGSGP